MDRRGLVEANCRRSTSTQSQDGRLDVAVCRPVIFLPRNILSTTVVPTIASPRAARGEEDVRNKRSGERLTGTAIP